MKRHNLLFVNQVTKTCLLRIYPKYWNCRYKFSPYIRKLSMDWKLEDNVGGFTYLSHFLGVVCTVIIPDIVAGHRHGAGPSPAPSQAHGTSVCGGEPARRARLTSLWGCLCPYSPVFAHFMLPSPCLEHSFIPPRYFLSVSYIFTSRAPPDIWLSAPCCQISQLRVISVFPLVVSLRAFFFIRAQFWFSVVDFRYKIKCLENCNYPFLKWNDNSL